MSTKVVKLNDFANEIARFTNTTLEQQKKATVRGVAKSIPDLVAASPVDTGLYASSWDFTEEEKGVIIGNYAPHAPIIENGARPFTPPIGPLLEWAKRVLTGQTGPDGKQIKTGQPEEGYSDEVWKLAKGTQKKIAENGMKPRAILEKALPSIIENVKQELKALT